MHENEKADIHAADKRIRAKAKAFSATRKLGFVANVIGMARRLARPKSTDGFLGVAISGLFCLHWLEQI